MAGVPMPNGVADRIAIVAERISAPTTLFIEGQPPGPPVPGFSGRDMFTGSPLPCGMATPGGQYRAGVPNTCPIKLHQVPPGSA
ncbi:hypothetical protein [Mycolicibacterium sp. 624]|uniref:hypothetical protein n=1 Tax=Mycolicibacterium sp. 624 TaxID=3156314 RepID=UPI003399185A